MPAAKRGSRTSPRPTREADRKPEPDPRAPDEVAPPDLRAALSSSPGILESWEDLPPSRKREFVGAVQTTARPETRMRRIEQILGLLSALIGESRKKKAPGRRQARPA